MEVLKPNPASSCSLEITVISAQNLFVDRNPATENAFVVVRAESINCCTTTMAREGGSCPSWNEKFLLDIPLHARSVTFEVQCKIPTGAVRSVGVARIAVSDFLAAGSVPANLQLLSYRLRNWDGRRSGVINFSVKVKSPEDSIPAVKPAKGMVVSSSEFDSEVTGVQVSDEKNSNGVATGIPIWWNYPTNMFQKCN
ncbi:hypothetical protein L6164_001921 [Bauhinia variegata]|uniref:Uncharacterized protein n=1 Tax=Bauhinia variegata TaxID=167791 RepID=A0ACB9QB08_BAUVA|nr:hypothetical protein L6164_001921 [Bauhinia variegata]